VGDIQPVCNAQDGSQSLANVATELMKSPLQLDTSRNNAAALGEAKSDNPTI
jgi:hypothetical protein